MPVRRSRIAALIAVFIVISIYYLTKQRNTWDAVIPSNPNLIPATENAKKLHDGRVHWSKLPEKHPVTSLITLPTGAPKNIPLVQAAQPVENAQQRDERLRRRATVKDSFKHSWDGYKAHAWLRDEVAPLSGNYKETFGGWAASLVDALDTLWIMGMTEDFELVVKAIKEIDFTTTDTNDINVFETTIRYLGGFLAAYDISGGKYPALLAKATEVGELLMSCFDTPNRFPITRWDWKKYMRGDDQSAPLRMLVSEPGSLSLEFTRLSQLTRNPKYYDAVQRISNEFEAGQNTTKLPGMWPVSIDGSKPSFSGDNFFSLGGMSDSLYEYFPKQYLILGGLLDQPKKLYEIFIDVVKEHMFFRIYNPKNEPLTVSGDVWARGTSHNLELELAPRGQHLTCFTGGMVGLASRIFDRPNDLQVAKELASACVWAYDSNPNGIAPELFSVIPCPKGGKDCIWTDDIWHSAVRKSHAVQPETLPRTLQTIRNLRLPPGFTSIDDRRYILRPEAIESVFYMYRITGEQQWADAAWRMFQAVEKVSRTNIAAAAIDDITQPPGEVRQVDSMESFWLAETLKYFYLCFEEFDVVSLDDFVLNTEAHPLRRPR